MLANSRGTLKQTFLKKMYLNRITELIPYSSILHELALIYFIKRIIFIKEITLRID